MREGRRGRGLVKGKVIDFGGKVIDFGGKVIDFGGQVLFVFSWFCWLFVGSVCFSLVPLVAGRFCLLFVGSAGCG